MHSFVSQNENHGYTLLSHPFRAFLSFYSLILIKSAYSATFRGEKAMPKCVSFPGLRWCSASQTSLLGSMQISEADEHAFCIKFTLEDWCGIFELNSISDLWDKHGISTAKDWDVWSPVLSLGAGSNSKYNVKSAQLKLGKSGLFLGSTKSSRFSDQEFKQYHLWSISL